MQKILIILAAVLSLASAVFGYLNRANLLNERSITEQTMTTLSSTKVTLGKTTAELKIANEKMSELTTDNSDKEKQVADLSDNVTKLKATIDDAQKQMADKDATLAQNKTDLDAKDARIHDLETQLSGSGSAPNAELDELKKQVNEKDVLIAAQQSKLKDEESQISTFRKLEADRQGKILRKGLEGKILAVNSSWNFVVLSLGDRNGVVENAEMLIKRGDQLIGKVRVTSAEPSTSIADIVVNSVPSGLSIQPGDSVIYNGPDTDPDAK